MSAKSERELTQAHRDLVSRAKAALQSRNYDYTISLLLSVLKAEPLYLEGRKILRAAEVQKTKALSSMQRQMLSVKVASSALKLSSLGKKDPAEVMVQAEEVLALDPFHPRANVLVAEAGEALGLPEIKALSYETLAEGKPGDKAVLHKLAEVYMELKDPGKAEKTYERILQIDPRDGEALSGQKNASAAFTSRSGGWDTAKDYRGVLKSQEESIKLEQAAKVVKSDEAIQAQINQLFAQHQADPANVNYPKQIGNLFNQKGDLGSAIEWYQYAYASGGKIDSALEKLIGDLSLKKAENDLQELRTALEQQPDPEIQAQLQEALTQKEAEFNQVRLHQAETRVKNHPNEGQFHFELGEVLFRIGDYRRALQEFQISLKQPSVRYQAMNYMGLCYLNLRMNDFAIKTLTTAENEMVGMDDLKKEVVYNLGRAYDAAGQPDKGLEQDKKIYEFDMSYKDVAQRVESSYGNG